MEIYNSMGLTAGHQDNVKIKFVSRALKDDIELLDMMETSKSLNHDVTFVQETHRTGSDILNFEDGWKFLHSLRHEHAQGVGMIISPNTRVDGIEYVMDSHIVHALLTLSGIKISAICAYNDRECSTESSNTMLFTKLKKTIAMNKRKYPDHRTLVVGNFNNLIGTEVVPSCDLEMRHGACVKNESNYMKLCTLCEDLKLYVLNTVPHNEDINSFTWKHPTGYIRHIDYFLADYLMTQCTTNCIAYQDGVHHGNEKSEILLVLESECSELTHYLEQLITDFKGEVNPDIIKNSDMMAAEDAVVAAHEMTTTSDRHEQETKGKRPHPWYDDRYQSLLQDMRECNDVGEKKNLKRRLKKDRIRLKSAYYKQKVSAVNVRDEMRAIQEEFCKLKDCKNIKKIGYLEHSNDCSSSSCANNQICPMQIIFENHNIEQNENVVVDNSKNADNEIHNDHNEKQPEIVNPENYPFLKPNSTKPIDESPPSEKEIDTAIKNVIFDKHSKDNGGSSGGNDSASGRDYVHSKPFLQVLISLIRAAWMIVMYPACWLHSRLGCFLKNTGPHTAVKNYNGMSMGDTLNKILTSVIFGRIKTLYESNIMECQFGFRKNRSSTDAIFTVRKMLEYTDGFYIACLVDIETASSNINCESLFDVLEIRTGSKLVGQLIRELYYNTSAAVYSAKETIRTFVGCSHAESPCLFKIYIDFVLRICQHEVLQKYPKTGLKYKFNYPPDISSDTTSSDSTVPDSLFTLRLLACADDFMVMSRDIGELEHVMSIYYRIFNRFGMTLDIGKICTIVYNAHEEMCAKESLITINGHNVANVREISFLGYVISNVDRHEYLEHYITCAFRKWSEMENILTDREIHLPIRIRLLETFIRSRLLYLAQTRKLNPIDLKKVDGVWTNLLRRMVKGGFKRHKTSVTIDDNSKEWSYLYSNKEIANIANSQPLSKFCEVQYLKYIARVVRQQDSFYPKIMLFTQPEKKNVRGEWTFLEEFTGLEKGQLRMLMMDKGRFTRWLSERWYGS